MTPCDRLPSVMKGVRFFFELLFFQVRFVEKFASRADLGYHDSNLGKISLEATKLRKNVPVFLSFVFRSGKVLLRASFDAWRYQSLVLFLSFKFTVATEYE